MPTILTVPVVLDVSAFAHAAVETSGVWAHLIEGATLAIHITGEAAGRVLCR